jgi:hypothetical protein
MAIINRCPQTYGWAIGSQQAVPKRRLLWTGQTRTLTFPGGVWSGGL